MSVLEAVTTRLASFAAGRESEIERAKKSLLKFKTDPESVSKADFDKLKEVLGLSDADVLADATEHERRKIWSITAKKIPALQAEVDKHATEQTKLIAALRDFEETTRQQLGEASRLESLAVSELRVAMQAKANLTAGRPNLRIAELQSLIGNGRERASTLRDVISANERNVAACRALIKTPALTPEHLFLADANRLWGAQAGGPGIVHVVKTEDVHRTLDVSTLNLQGAKTELARLETDLKAWGKELAALEKLQLEP